MPKRVLVLLSGCGAGDGSDPHEALLTLLSIERSGARGICAAPAQPLAPVFDHLLNQVVAGATRQPLVEAARLSRGPILDLGATAVDQFDALIVPGGAGVGTILSNYALKAQLCDIHPDVVRLLKAALGTHRPMGFIGLASVLAARVLGPVAGVRLTLGPRTVTATKHAAVMGADIRPSAINDIFIDKKSRVISTGGFLHEELHLGQAGQAIDKLVRTVVHLARDRDRPPGPPSPEAGAPPGGGRRSAGPPRANPGRGSA